MNGRRVLRLRRGSLALVALALFSLTAAAMAAERLADFQFLPVPTASKEGARPVPKFQNLFGFTARWALPYRWKYNHANAPGPFTNDPAGTIAQIQARLDHWTASCGFTHVYEGETTTPPDNRIQHPVFGEQPDGQNVVGWGSLDTGAGGVTAAWWAPVNDVPMVVDADFSVSTSVTTNSRLMRVATHEWGHVLGLAHSNVTNTLMSGPPDTAYASNILDPLDDDLQGCRCLYGPPAGQTAGLLCSLPKKVDFGTVLVNTTPVARSFDVRNDGTAPLTIAAVLAETPEVKPQSGCPDGTVLAPGQLCTMHVTVRADFGNARAPSVVLRTSDGDYRVPLAYVGTLPGPGAGTTDVIEYYNATLDHYFISALAADIQALDSGQLKGWARTGLTFKAYPTFQPGTSSVCRFYIPPANGDSHFYSASTTECEEVRVKFPTFVYESPNVMFIALPDSVTGACPAGTMAVYRMWNNRADSNHRYTTDLTVKAQMLARGYIAEGYGPNQVIMCAPV